MTHPLKSPTSWCAPIAVQKRNDKSRLYVESTKRNESIQREKFALPNTGQQLSELDETTIFSKLKCNSGLSPNNLECTLNITPGISDKI